MLIVPCDNTGIAINLELNTELCTCWYVSITCINNRRSEAYFIARINGFLVEGNLCNNEVIASCDRSIVSVVILFSYIKLLLTAVIVSCYLISKFITIVSFSLYNVSSSRCFPC